ncbi:Rtc3p [Ascoidea rubescens DSM 1968]|uniref:DUF1960-domain-containing protein n=1 Tax=Ascoidea rubescens DSM 1968 TaxID=1344418 RepID=A0A1D2VCT8_9ASCO|nr:DUF1960-domain-containing protein [Ascoidea rubescens DSM 1968]ODV59313.1 DUF1960-domain-containing protein [Ascoidea rubescens DSM 1968]
MSSPIKVVYPGKHNDFIAFADSIEAVENYRKNDDGSIPLSSVSSNFKIYNSSVHRGSSGVLEEASNIELESEFGTTDEDKIIKIIIKEGSFKTSKSFKRKSFSSTNDTKGSLYY